jgi:glutamate synthase (NADPH/NADH) large chain
VVQVDGQLKTGRDVVIAALLGGEEFGFATAPLVVSGCVMMRVCHLDTCPVGVATQNPELRKRFTGKPEFVVNFFEFIAEEVREILAELGFRSLDEAIGHSELLDSREAIDHWKASGLDLAPILHQVHVAGTHFPDQDVRNTRTQNHGLEKSLDVTQLLPVAAPAIDNGEPVRARLPIRNVHRTVGTILGHEVTKKYGGDGLPDDTVDITFTGSAGQSFGAFVPRGITLRLEGDANDYVGKGLSGGRIAIRPDRSASFKADDHIIAGNTIAYGATSGEIFIRGGVGERCCVRNSGATVVTEGVGDHGCEYMTGGKVAVLGNIGRNFAAGMSGGVAWVLDLEEFRVNRELVELGPVTASSLEHQDELHQMVKRHFEETASEVAEELLADWPTSLARFTEVMPRDFRIVLEAKAKAEADGLDEDGVANAMMEALHG